MTIYAHNCPQTMTADTSGIFHRLSSWGRHFLLEQSLNHAIAKERKQLAKLSEAMLNDIGIDRSTAIAEARRTAIPTSRKAHISC